MEVSFGELSSKVGLIGVGLLSLVALAFLVFGVALLWGLGLILPFTFLVIGILILYTLNGLGVKVRDNRWLLVVPFGFFGVGFVADRFDLLSVQPLSVTGVESMSLGVGLCVVILVLFVSCIGASMFDEEN